MAYELYQYLVLHLSSIERNNNMSYTLYSKSLNRAILSIDDSKIDDTIINNDDIVVIDNGADVSIESLESLDNHEYWNNKAQEIITTNNTLEHAISIKKQEIAYARMQAETSGTIINGININTDRDSQSKITGAAVQAIDDPSYTCQWKTDDGIFVTIDADTIKIIARGIRTYVQSCFDKEAAIISYLDTLTNKEDVDKVTWNTWEPSNNGAVGIDDDTPINERDNSGAISTDENDKEKDDDHGIVDEPGS